MNIQEKVENTKEIIKRRKLKDRRYNDKDLKKHYTEN